MREGEYQEIALSKDGILKSDVFAGLWLDLAALLRGGMKAVLATLRRGCESEEQAKFLKAVATSGVGP